MEERNQQPAPDHQEVHQQDQARATPSRPEDTLRDGAVKASIWKNEGERGAYFSTSFARTYQDDQGNTRDSQSFQGTDLLKVAELARQAYARSNELRREEQEARREQFRQDRETAQPQKREAPARDPGPNR